MNKIVRVAPILLLSIILCPALVQADAVEVQLRETPQGWQLFRGGEPYLIRGAGVDASASPADVKAAGGNSIRTWGAEDIDALLDEAHELGLTVTVGIWLGHERHGFDYADKTQVREQFERAREIVLRYKDHPAVLLWGIGNEMEGWEEADNPAIWKAVNDIAVMVKEIDPQHPTMTVTAYVHGQRIPLMNELCPAIDIHGINAYGAALTLPQVYRDRGGKKPYVLTEFGPPGQWEVAKTDWGAPLEPTSTEKADHYRQSYQNAVIDSGGLALGSYVFYWGHKMEATSTWFGMFLADGSRLATVDTMTELWTGKAPTNRAPGIRPLTIVGSHEVKPGAKIEARAEVTDPEGGKIDARWVLRAESGDYLTGGDFRPALPDIEGAVLKSSAERARIKMPEDPGPYRLFLYANDEAGNAAIANMPLLVKGEVHTRFPFYVYHDTFEGMPWVPSGWMGSIDALTLDGEHAENPHKGSACVEIKFAGKVGSWAGIAWQHPANNWGDQDGGFNLDRARYLELWARGKYGGERVSFGTGLIGSDKPYPDSGQKKIDGIVLTSEWTRYRIPLRGVNLDSLKTGFVITTTGRSTPVAIYLDTIRFVR